MIVFDFCNNSGRLLAFVVFRYFSLELNFKIKLLILTPLVIFCTGFSDRKRISISKEFVIYFFVSCFNV